MGAGVAELKEQLAAVNVQLAAAPPDKHAELLDQQAALEAELKAAQAKKSANSAAAGAWCLLSSFSHARPAVSPAPLPHAPLALHLTNTILTLLCALPFMQAATWGSITPPRTR